MKKLAILLLLLISLSVNAQSDFTQEEISDEIFQSMQGKSWAKGCTMKRNDLRHLKVLYYDFDGKEQHGELICNKAISKDLLEIFEGLYNAKYQIAKMVLIDEYGADDEKSMADNNTSCFNFRKVSGKNTLSKHSMGMAIDINPLFNPYIHTVKGKKIVEPANAGKYANRSASFPGKIDTNDLCYRLFIQHGFRWGGSWRYSKDYQHFEK